MPVYEMSCRTTLVTATIAAPLAALRAVTRAARIWEIHAMSATAPTTSGGLGLCYSTALGTGGLTSVVPVARSSAVRVSDTSTSVLVTAWATLAPTNAGAGAIFRRLVTSPAIGNALFWTFDREPLEVAGGAAATSELCVVNTFATAPGTWDITFVFEE